MRSLTELVRTYTRRGKKQWPNRQEDLPWFDQPNAVTLLEQRRRDEKLSDKEFEDLRHWAEHGYVVLQDVVKTDDIDGMWSDLDRIWTTNKPIANLTIESLRLQKEDPPGLPHAKLVTLDAETKEGLKSAQRWRVHAFSKHSDSTNRIFKNAELKRATSSILKYPTQPRYTINFAYGSSQELHQDSAVFFLWPRNYLIGAWLACEDIHPDCGPLVYYPGSQKEPMFAGFDNYPQTNLKTCPKPQSQAYYRYVEEIAGKYERKAFIAKKGEVLLWHGMLIHGGDVIRNPALTRRSYVCHYLPPKFNREPEVEGPFNW